MKFPAYAWQLYKQSDEGKEVIKSFRPECELDCYDVAVKCNPNTSDIDKAIYADMADSAFCWLSDEGEIATPAQAKQSFETLIDRGMCEEGDMIISAKDYQMELAALPATSFGLYACSKFFFPNLFVYNFYALRKLADTFELELPAYPKKSDYRARCMYYWDLCEMFYDFRTKNGMSGEELCAFIYHFTPNFIGQETPYPLPKPANAWFIGGILPDKDKRPDFISSWQANVETKRGDILIHYETSPISALTGLWIASSDGVIDPFFHWYAWAYISNYTPITPITLKELKADPYFATHSLIRKGFQGVNGWQITGQDYNELLRMIKSKGGDTSSLPQLYAPPAPRSAEIKLERDVEVELLEYFLGKMGFVENRDYRRQLPIHAGRGHRVFPDYALHYDQTPDYEKARVLIEAKLEMRNNVQIEECFKQAYSYAKLLESSVIVLCDRQGLLVYQKQDNFDRSKYKKYYWGELENVDAFNDLKNKLKNLK